MITLIARKGFARAFCALLVVSSMQFALAQQTEQALRDAVLGAQSVSADELSALDQNADNRLDVADLAFLLKGGTIPLSGYKWLVNASFASDLASTGSFARNYTFALTVDGSTATVSTLDELNPTKGLLQQELSGPGELPGQNRPDYGLTQLLPIGTTFGVTQTASGFELLSESVTVPSDDAANPTGVAITRTWTMSVSTADVFSDALDHGVVVESVAGFLPGGAVTTATGRSRWTRYSPSVLVPLDEP